MHLDPENEEVLDTYNLIYSQVSLSGMGDVIGLRYEGVIAAIQLYFPDKVKWMFENMLFCYNVYREVQEGVDEEEKQQKLIHNQTRTPEQ